MTEFILCNGQAKQTCPDRDTCARYTTHRVEGDKVLDYMCGVDFNTWRDFYMQDVSASHD